MISIFKSLRAYHDGWEVHAGHSIHDDEDPGIRQVVETVVQTDCKEKRSNCESRENMSLSKDRLQQHWANARLETWRQAAEGQSSMRTRSWAGAQRQRQ